MGREDTERVRHHPGPYFALNISVSMSAPGSHPTVHGPSFEHLPYELLAHLSSLIDDPPNRLPGLARVSGPLWDSMLSVTTRARVDVDGEGCIVPVLLLRRCLALRELRIECVKSYPEHDENPGH